MAEARRAQLISQQQEIEALRAAVAEREQSDREASEAQVLQALSNAEKESKKALIEQQAEMQSLASGRDSAQSSPVSVQPASQLKGDGAGLPPELEELSPFPRPAQDCIPSTTISPETNGPSGNLASSAGGAAPRCSPSYKEASTLDWPTDGERAQGASDVRALHARSEDARLRAAQVIHSH